MIADWSKYPNFSEDEMRCKCGCGRCDMDRDFMEGLQACRNWFAAPMPVSSGYRCPDHNEQVSSTGRDGPHTTGKAADIAISGADAARLIQTVPFGYFTGIGVKQKGRDRFIHLDILNADEAPRPMIWSY